MLTQVCGSMSKKILSVLLIALLIAVSAPVATAAEGTTHYVNEGESIQDAIDNADEGDTVIVNPGIYDEGRIYVDKSLTLRGSGADATLILGCILVGFDERDSGICEESMHYTIANMTVNTLTYTGLDGSDVMPAIGGMVRSDTSGLDGKIRVSCSVTVSGCTTLSALGMYFEDFYDVEIRHNELYGFSPPEAESPLDGEVSVSGDGCGIAAVYCNNVSIDSNSIFSFYDAGMAIGECETVSITNNIVNRCDDWGINADAHSLIIANNSLYENGYGAYVDSYETSVVNNIFVLATALYGDVDGYSQQDIDISAEYDIAFKNNDIFLSGNG